MLDLFFNNRFDGAKCKTLLKLTISRIKLLRNKSKNRLKQMHKEIGEFLLTGKEAAADISVEQIVWEQNMMDVYEIIELFCEIVVVSLPVIENQRSNIYFVPSMESNLLRLLQNYNQIVVLTE